MREAIEKASCVAVTTILVAALVVCIGALSRAILTPPSDEVLTERRERKRIAEGLPHLFTVHVEGKWLGIHAYDHQLVGEFMVIQTTDWEVVRVPKAKIQRIETKGE